jgi:hypothetical protein
MLKQTIVFLCVFVVFSKSYAQDYIEQHFFSIEVEAGVSPPILNGLFRNLSFPGNGIYSNFYDRSYLPPNLGMNIGFTLSDQLRSIVRLSWKGLQNNGFTYTSSTNSYQMNGLTVLQSYTDSLKMSSDSKNATFGLRYYTTEVPRGAYVELNCGYSEVTSTVYPIFINSNTTLYQGDEVVITDKRAPGLYKNGFFSTSFGFGGSIVFDNRMYLDLGARISYFYGKYYLASNLNDVAEKITDYRNNFDNYLRFSQLSNLQSSFLLEAHVGFGIYL